MRVLLNTFIASVDPKDVTALPLFRGAVAKNAAILSVVPA